MASRLLATSLIASRQPLWTGPISPPSGACVTSSGASEEPRPDMMASYGRDTSVQPDPRISDGQRDIGYEVAQYRQHGSDQGVREEHRVILLRKAVVEQQAETV